MNQRPNVSPRPPPPPPPPPLATKPSNTPTTSISANSTIQITKSGFEPSKILPTSKVVQSPFAVQLNPVGKAGATSPVSSISSLKTSTDNAISPPPLPPKRTQNQLSVSSVDSNPSPSVSPPPLPAKPGEGKKSKPLTSVASLGSSNKTLSQDASPTGVPYKGASTSATNKAPAFPPSSSSSKPVATPSWIKPSPESSKTPIEPRSVETKPIEKSPTNNAPWVKKSEANSVSPARIGPPLKFDDKSNDTKRAPVPVAQVSQPIRSKEDGKTKLEENQKSPIPPPLPPRRKASTTTIIEPIVPSADAGIESSPRDISPFAVIMSSASKLKSTRSNGSDSSKSPSDRPAALARRPSRQPSAAIGVIKGRDLTPEESKERSSPLQRYIDIYKTGLMYKTNRDGKEVQYLFTLDEEALSYTEPGLSLMIGAVSTVEGRVLPLNSLIVRDLDDLDEVAPVAATATSQAVQGVDNKNGFRLLSKQKSFFLRCESSEERNEWFRLISQLANEAQMRDFGRLFLEEEMALLKISRSKVSDCQLCGVPFGYFSRRHHCRNCGKCVCDECSREKVRIERIDEKALFKVCSDCAKEIKNNRKYGF